nr:MAG TPA: hypothetical protein [Caudoviricetes sp.]
MYHNGMSFYIFMVMHDILGKILLLILISE